MILHLMKKEVLLGCFLFVHTFRFYYRGWLYVFCIEKSFEVCGGGVGRVKLGERWCYKKNGDAQNFKKNVLAKLFIING